MSIKTIKIACKGADTKDIDELEEYQGNLKSLSTANYKKLRKEILELGFSEPISVWQNNGSSFILNGHQRLRVLKKMREDGYDVSAVPVNYVDAENEVEAKRKILSLTSQYGNMTEDGLYEFMHDAAIDIEEVAESFNFPEIDLRHLGNGGQKSGESDHPHSAFSIQVTQEQREVIDIAIEKVRQMNEDEEINEGRCVELICADFLSGV